MRSLKGFKSCKVIQFAPDEETLVSRSSLTSHSDNESGTYARFILAFEVKIPRGYNKELKEEYELMMDELPNVLRANEYLDILPGTFITKIETGYMEETFCTKTSCMNDGICIGLATDYICRCKMEFYGKRCQHTKYHTPGALEVPVVAVSSRQVRLRWIRPPEDPSIGATIEKIHIWGMDIDAEYGSSINEAIITVEPETSYKLHTQIVYRNGLRSLIKSISFVTSPILDTFNVVDVTDTSVTVGFSEHPSIISYNIFETEVDPKTSKPKLGSLLWSGSAGPATIYSLEPNTFYKLSLLGYVDGGTTDLIQVTAETALTSPTLDWKRLKVGWTSAIIAWNAVRGAVGYTVQVYEANPKILIQDYTLDKNEDRIVDIRKLSYDHAYLFEIKALGRQKGGDSPVLQSSFQTEPRAPVYNGVIHVNVTEIRTSEARISWEEQDYTVVKQLLYLNDEDPIELNPDVNNFVMDSFIPFQSYIVSLVTVDEYGITSERGEGTKFTTAHSFGNIKIDVTETTIVYQWQKIPGAKYFMLRQSLGNRKFEEIRAEQTMYRREALRPDTEYSFEIYAVIDDITRTDIKTVTVKTSPKLAAFRRVFKLFFNYILFYSNDVIIKLTLS